MEGRSTKDASGGPKAGSSASVLIAARGFTTKELVRAQQAKPTVKVQELVTKQAVATISGRGVAAETQQPVARSDLARETRAAVALQRQTDSSPVRNSRRSVSLVEKEEIWEMDEVNVAELVNKNIELRNELDLLSAEYADIKEMSEGLIDAIIQKDEALQERDEDIRAKDARIEELRRDNAMLSAEVETDDSLRVSADDHQKLFDDCASLRRTLALKDKELARVKQSIHELEAYRDHAEQRSMVRADLDQRLADAMAQAQLHRDDAEHQREELSKIRNSYAMLQKSHVSLIHTQTQSQSGNTQQKGTDDVELAKLRADLDAARREAEFYKNNSGRLSKTNQMLVEDNRKLQERLE